MVKPLYHNVLADKDQIEISLVKTQMFGDSFVLYRCAPAGFGSVQQPFFPSVDLLHKGPAPKEIILIGYLLAIFADSILHTGHRSYILFVK